MKVYVDCDVAVKLAQWGLLTRFTQHLIKQGKADLYTVRTLRYRFKLADKYKAAAMLKSMSAVDQLASFVAQCKPPLVHRPDVAAALADVPSVDAGEAALFAAAAHYDAALVDTGDKNALRAIGALGPAHVANRLLAGKVACLEQTLQYLVGRWTFEIMSKAVASHPEADPATTRHFSRGDEAETMGRLTKKLDELRPQCSLLLAPMPFSWVPLR